MTLIYYTRANGEIRHAHKKPDKWTSKELEEKVANYNRREDGERAHVVEVEDDSITAYLYKEAHAVKNANREMIMDTIDALEAAISALRDLEE